MIVHIKNVNTLRIVYLHDTMQAVSIWAIPNARQEGDRYEP